MKDKQEALNEALKEIRELQEKAQKAFDDEAETHWNSLTKDEQLMAFYSVCKRIHKGDIEDGGTYRYVLYDTFGFGPEAYMIGMTSGYMAIHNSIVGGTKNEVATKVSI